MTPFASCLFYTITASGTTESLLDNKGRKGGGVGAKSQHDATGSDSFTYLGIKGKSGPSSINPCDSNICMDKAYHI